MMNMWWTISAFVLATASQHNTVAAFQGLPIGLAAKALRPDVSKFGVRIASLPQSKEAMNMAAANNDFIWMNDLTLFRLATSAGTQSRLECGSSKWV